MFNLGFSELILLAIIALVFIGPKQLPELAQSLGRMLNEFKRVTGDIHETIANPDRFIDESKSESDKSTTENPHTEDEKGPTS